MPTYRYTALKRDGAKHDGLLTADTPQDARGRLHDMQLYVQRVEEVRPGAGDGIGRIRLHLRARARRGAIALLTRQLSTLLRTGIPLSDALGALIDEEKDPLLNPVLRDVRERVISGTPLARALAEHPLLFPPLYSNMVAAGEASGTLDAILKRLADFLSGQNRVRGRLVAALIYPVLLVAVAILAIAFLMIVVIPQLEANLSSMGVDMPFLTRWLIGASRVFAVGWWIPLLGAAAAWTAIASLCRRSVAFRLALHGIVLRIPLFGTLIKKQAIVRFSHTMSTLLESGIPAVDALDIVRSLMGNAVMQETVGAIRQRIIEGADIARPMRASGIFPPVVAYMISVGERTGELDKVLAQLSESFEEEIDAAIERFLSLISPIMIICLAVAIGLIVLSILWPIMEMTTSFQTGR